jgi:hypothetical protein
MRYLLVAFTAAGVIDGTCLGYCFCMWRLHARHETEDHELTDNGRTSDRVDRVMQSARAQMDGVIRRHQTAWPADTIGHWSDW